MELLLEGLSVDLVVDAIGDGLWWCFGGGFGGIFLIPDGVDLRMRIKKGT